KYDRRFQQGSSYRADWSRGSDRGAYRRCDAHLQKGSGSEDKGNGAKPWRKRGLPKVALDGYSMRCIGIDYGERRVGVSYGDDIGVATPLPAIVKATEVERLQELRD